MADTLNYSRFKVGSCTGDSLQERRGWILSQDLVIRLATRPFNLLSSVYPHEINHEIPDVSVPAPSIEQYYQCFKVFVTELKNPTVNTTYSYVVNFGYDLPENFFKEIDTAFVKETTQKNSYSKYTGKSHPSKPVYWLSYNKSEQKYVKVSMLRAKIVYCRLYEKFILSSPFFKLLYDQYKQYNGDVTILSYGVCNKFTHFENRDELIQFFCNSNYDFSDCYCLIEILLNYPNTDRCFWNDDDMLQPEIDKADLELLNKHISYVKHIQKHPEKQNIKPYSYITNDDIVDAADFI